MENQNYSTSHCPYLTVRQCAERHSAFSEPSLRHLIFFAEKNGFDRCMRRIGRRGQLKLKPTKIGCKQVAELLIIINKQDFGHSIYLLDLGRPKAELNFFCTCILSVLTTNNDLGYKKLHGRPESAGSACGRSATSVRRDQVVEDRLEVLVRRDQLADADTGAQHDFGQALVEVARLVGQHGDLVAFR